MTLTAMGHQAVSDKWHPEGTCSRLFSCRLD